jgi:hypothetical protein
VIWLGVAMALMIALIAIRATDALRKLEIAVKVGVVVFAWFASREPGARDVRGSPDQKLGVAARRPNERSRQT